MVKTDIQHIFKLTRQFLRITAFSHMVHDLGCSGETVLASKHFKLPPGTVLSFH